ncbi:MAG: peptide chain release factor 1 [Enterobacteriaceae bacterium]
MEKIIKKKIEDLSNINKKKKGIINSKKFDNKKIYNLYNEINENYKKIKLLKNWEKLKKEIIEIKKLLLDEEMYDIAKKELSLVLKKKVNLEKEIFILFSKNDLDFKKINGCFLEIRAATGGNEASLFAKELLKMYIKFIEKKKWKLKIVHCNSNEYGGYKEVILKIYDKNSYYFLQFESGGHRVQRVPKTEAKNRIHTSSCTVAVLQKTSKEILPKINSKDLRIDTFRSSGAGGQHTNKTDSAIRIVHMPSGITVECQNERSQHKNKKRAMDILKNKIRYFNLRKIKKEQSEKRKTLLGSGYRSDRIRTYNFQKKRVTDHRIGLTLYSLEEIISGKLELLVYPILKKYSISYLSFKENK